MEGINHQVEENMELIDSSRTLWGVLEFIHTWKIQIYFKYVNVKFSKREPFHKMTTFCMINLSCFLLAAVDIQHGLHHDAEQFH